MPTTGKFNLHITLSIYTKHSNWAQFKLNYRRLGVVDAKEPISKPTAGKIDTKDQHIMERLNKLKEDKSAKPPATTDEEIKNRLQNIKGETPSTSDADIQARLARLRGVPIETITSKVLHIILHIHLY